MIPFQYCAPFCKNSVYRGAFFSFPAPVTLKRYILPFSFFFVVATCSAPSIVNTPDVQEIQFRDRQQLLEARVPAGAKSHSFEGQDYNYYVFEWWEGDQPITRLEFRVLGSGFSDLMQPDYEAVFQRECGCAINQKGWVLAAGQKAREFQFTLEDGKQVSIERRFEWKGHMIQIQIIAPAARQEQMRTRFQAVLPTLNLL